MLSFFIDLVIFALLSGAPACVMMIRMLVTLLQVWRNNNTCMLCHGSLSPTYNGGKLALMLANQVRLDANQVMRCDVLGG